MNQNQDYEYKLTAASGNKYVLFYYIIRVLRILFIVSFKVNFTVNV
jgi:hypothetical protein